METSWKVRLGGLSILGIGIAVAGLAYAIQRGDDQRMEAYTRQQQAMQQLASQNLQPTVTPTPTPAAPPIVTIENETKLPLKRRQQLYDRIVSPILDYYQSAKLAAIDSVSIQANTMSNSKQYPYTGTVLTHDGGNMGFLIEEKAGAISWWKPECLGTCTFTAEYKAKYPEVVQ